MAPHCTEAISSVMDKEQNQSKGHSLIVFIFFFHHWLAGCVQKEWSIPTAEESLGESIDDWTHAHNTGYFPSFLQLTLTVLNLFEETSYICIFYCF